MTDKRGKSKIKIVNASDMKEAEAKAKEKYPSFEVGRITRDINNLEFYANMKNFNE